MGCFNSSNKNTSKDSIPIIKSNSLPYSQIKEKSKSDGISELKTKDTLIKIKSNNFIKEGEGTIDDNYKILDKLGSGTFGDVFKVKHIQTGLIRAMKVVKIKPDEKVSHKRNGSKQGSKENSSTNLRDFVKEIKILTELDHPNIVKIYDYYNDENKYYIITEYISGGELYDTILKCKSFKEKTAAWIFYQILSAVNYLNRKKIVHRDIKPENILITKDLNLKLIDFGTGRFTKEESKMKTRVGTSYYIAPEVIRKEYDEKCDIWSCGVILHILLVGCPPFHGKSNSEILNKILVGNDEDFLCYLQTSKVSPLAKDLLFKLLAYDPNNRITAAEALQHPWIIGSHVREENYDENFARNVIENIKKFNAREKLQQATIAYIVHFIYGTEDYAELIKIFKLLDKNCDGRISLNEFEYGYQKYFGKLLSDLDYKTVFKKLDQDRDGYLEYEEFLRASLNQKAILAEKNLKIAFNNFDVNKDGKLSFNEVKNILNTEDKEFVDQLFEKFDINKDGVLCFEEFCLLMKEMGNETFDI